MRSNAKRIAALTLAVLMSLSALPGLAGEYSSGTLNVKDKVKQPVSAATEEAVETPAPETGKKEEASEPTPAPTEAPTATPYVFSPWSGWIDASEASNYVATVCSSPNGSLVGQIRRGERVNVVEEKNGWLLIEGAVSGWVMDRYVSGSEPEPIRVEKPAATEVPEVTEEPVETEEPEVIEEPVQTEEPVETEEPVADETTEPAETEEPVADETTEPVETEEPVADETAEPVETEEPVADETTEPEPTEGLEETPAPEVTEEPSAEPEATPVPMVKVVPEAEIMFERDAEGNLVLDENGDPIAYVRGSLEAPLNFERDAEGNLVLDENGNPAVYILVQAAEEPVAEPEETEIPAEAEATPIVAQNVNVEYIVNEQGETVQVVTFDPIDNMSAGEGAAIRFAPSGLSEIIATITAGEPVTVVAIHGDWVKVIAGGVEGYVYQDDINMKDVEGLPEAEAPEASDPTENFKVTIFSSRSSVMAMGETVYLTSKLEGFDGYETMLQWQCDKGNGFEDVPGANADTYSFSASIETLGYDWRLAVYYR